MLLDFVCQTLVMSRSTRRGGRPTLDEAARLEHDIREQALALFLENGYEATTMDAIAGAAGTTKATLYGRFPGKEAIFRAVFSWAVARRGWPVKESALPDPDDLEVALREVARMAVRNATHPSMVRLSRIAVAQADRFPDLTRQAERPSPVWPRLQFVADTLERHAAAGAITLPGDPRLLAELFLGMASSVPARLAAFGIVREEEDQDQHTELAVQVFLRSLRPDRATELD